ncbi:MAG: glycosyltransferase family 39 protein [Candidatus Omnitrophica bacterium]|nr:glycosyltransferase family 39 protein [Candidatus Omnitrophota bacterium]
MTVWKWLKSEKSQIAFLVFCAAVIRVLLLLKFDNMPGDATGTVERALGILEDPGLIRNFDGNSSTLYKYMIASVMALWRDPVLAPRVFSTVFGILFVIPYYQTLRVLFGRTVAFFSGLVVVFYPLHVIQSSVAASEAVYYFFLFAALYHFFRFLENPGKGNSFWIAAGLFNVASLLRFESWAFIPVFFFLLFPRGVKKAFLFAGLAATLPCLYLVLNGTVHHDIFYTFNAAGRTARVEIAEGRIPYDPAFWSWAKILWRSSGPGIAAGGLGGLALAFLTRQKRALAAFFLVAFFSMTANSFMARMWHHPRYSIILALFLIPYGWFLVQRFLGLIKMDRKVFYFLFFLVPAVNFWQMPFSALASMFCFTPSAVKEVAQWLKTNTGPEDRLIIDADLSNAYPANILLRSGISPRKCLLLWRPTIYSEHFPSKQKFEQYLWGWRPRYLVLHSEGQITKMLGWDLTQKEHALGMLTFQTVKEEDLPNLGRYSIYRVSYERLQNDNPHA